MDLSKIPKNVLQVLQNPELSMPKKLVAFNMLIPNLSTDKNHAEAYNENLIVGRKIKDLIENGKIRLGSLDKQFKLEIIQN